MTAYAFTKRAGCKILVEFGNQAERRAAGEDFKPCLAVVARRWVKQGYIHETALYVDDLGKVKRATG